MAIQFARSAKASEPLQQQLNQSGTRNSNHQPDEEEHDEEGQRETRRIPNIRRNSIFRTSSFASFDIDKTIGWRIRDFVASCEDKLGPYVKWIIPSFIAAHYVYIIFMVFLCSILIYPVKNMEYIDALFFAAGSSTQAGLNTIDINQISLYQQIVIYVICCLTTPIFIHGSLCFLRLYWFERYFDNIRSSSKLNFKMRRAATLLERQKTMESQGGPPDTSKPGNRFSRTFSFSRAPSFGFNGAMSFGSKSSPRKDSNISPDSVDNNNFIDNNIANSSPENLNTSPKEDLSSSSTLDMANNAASPISYTKSAADLYSASQHPSEAHQVRQHPAAHNETSEAIDDDCDEDEAVVHNSEPSDTEEENHEEDNHQTGITFAEDLPKPSRRAEVTPRDMYMSISMLRNQNQTQQQLHNEPQANHNLTTGDYQGDYDENEGPALVIRGPAEREIQFDEPERRHRHKHKERNGEIRSKLADKKRSSLRKSLTKFNKPFSHGSAVATDDEYEDTEHGLVLELERAQSQLQLPSRDETGGLKFTKRSNTLDPSTVHENATGRSKIGFGKMKKGIKRRLSSMGHFEEGDEENASSARRGSGVSYTDTETDADDSDDEENEEDETGEDIHRTMSTNYLSWVPRVGRNSTFVNLTDQQKEELGGVEYRALKMLVKILVAYYIGFHVLAIIFLVPWIWKRQYYKAIVESYAINPTWWGFFTGMSSFTDLGYTLTANSMNSFNTSPYALLITAFFVIIGNTGFPIFLRFIIWVMFKFSRDLSLMKESLGFLLDHPRRCFTLLFPSAPTRWLLFILIVLNAIDLILFIVLDLNAAVLESLSTGTKVLDGFFQAVSTRTAGFSCVDLSQLHPSVQVSYMVMMYISVLPIAISIRRTNVYEEQSLGIFAVTSQGHLRRSHTRMADEDSDGDNTDEHAKATSFIGAHLRKQLSFDLWFIVLGVFIICIAEGDKIQDPKASGFDIWHVLFEVVSAYGTVGLSLGFPNTNASFSAQFNVVSKLVIILMMIRGRHRGLPYSLDRAIMLPSKQMERRDMVQDLHNRADSLDLSHQGHSQTVDTTNTSLHHSRNEDPVLQFLKSVTPDPISRHIRRPSAFMRRTSTADNGHGTRRPSTVGRSSIRRQSKIKEDDVISDYLNRDHQRRNETFALSGRETELRREREAHEEFKSIHFNHSSANVPSETVDPIEYEMDNLSYLRKKSKFRKGDDDDEEEACSNGAAIADSSSNYDSNLKVYETNPEGSKNFEDDDEDEGEEGHGNGKSFGRKLQTLGSHNSA